MDIRAFVGALLAAGTMATAGFVACRSGEPGPPPAPTNAALTTAPPTAGPSASLATGPAPPRSAEPADSVASAVAEARQCSTPTSRIDNQPDGGVVFNNAMHRKDAGNIDRLQGIVDAIVGSETAYRCCFDVWAKHHPASEGKLMLLLTLAADGSVKSAKIDPDRSDVDDEVTRACVAEVASTTSYPASPSKQDTLVEYPFAVSAP